MTDTVPVDGIPEVLDAGPTADSAAGRRRFPWLGPRGSAPRRVAVTTIDQCFASASNFAVGVVVARVAGPAGLGAYSVAYTVWLVLGMAHRAMVTDPMSIHNDARRDDAQERLRAGVAAEFGLGAVVGLALAVASVPIMTFGQRNIGVALLTLAPFLPFLLLQDFWRWVGFMQTRPGKSLANDTVFNCVQAALLVALIVAGLHAATVAIIAWGIGAIAGAAYGFRQYSIRPTHRGGVAMVGTRWPMSKWLLATGVASWGASQAYPIFAGPAVGSVGLGGLKAAQSLTAGPALVLLQAGGSIGLPEASHALETGGWEKLQRVARVVRIGSLIGVGSVAVVVYVAAGKLLHWAYGPEFVQYADTAKIIATAWVITTIGVGATLTLKVSRQTRRFFHIGLTSFLVTAISTVAFSYAWGVNGTAFAMLLNACVTTTALFFARRRTAREYREGRLDYLAGSLEGSAPDVANDVEHDPGAEAVEFDW